MKKTKVLGGVLIASMLLSSLAFAAENSQQNLENTDEKPARERPDDFMQNVECIRTNIENGVVITISSDDSDTIEKIQEREAENDRPEQENVTRTVENTDNGVKITLTSDDADTVTKLQNFEPGKGGHGPKGSGPQMDSEINFEKVNIDNGIQLTITTENSDKVSEIQDRAQNHPKPKDENITENIELLDNGVRITVTSDDSDTVTKIQNHEPGKEGRENRGQKPEGNLES